MDLNANMIAILTGAGALLTSAVGWIIALRKLPNERRNLDADTRKVIAEADSTLGTSWAQYVANVNSNMQYLQSQVDGLRARVKVLEDEKRILIAENHELKNIRHEYEELKNKYDILLAENVELRARLDALERNQNGGTNGQ